MAVAVTYLTILGPLLAGSHLTEWPVRGLLLVLPLWVGLELYIGLCRPFQGHVPTHWMVRVSRLLWLVSATYSWLDVRYGWTRFELPAAVTEAAVAAAARGTRDPHLGRGAPRPLVHL